MSTGVRANAGVVGELLVDHVFGKDITAEAFASEFRVVYSI